MNLPEKPEESDCCGSGCSPCVFDIYQQQLDRYNKCSANQSLDNDPNSSSNCILQTKYSQFRLTNIKYESLDTYLYTFTFINQDSSTENDLRLCYLPGQHFLIRGTDENNKYFTRAYTPLLNKTDNRVSFTVLIKLYNKGVMSKYLKTLTLNSETFWRGPYGSYRVNFELKNILMICQGTGIAPIYSLISQIIANEVCETMLKLLYCCRNSQTIHLHTDIYNLSAYWNFNYELFLTHIDEHFKPKYKERIHLRKLQATDLHSYLTNTNLHSGFQVLICGSEHFSNEIKEYVTDYGVNETCVHVF